MPNIYFPNKGSAVYIPETEPEEEQVNNEPAIVFTSRPRFFIKTMSESQVGTPLVMCTDSPIYIPTQECDSCDQFIELLNGKQDLLTAGTGISIIDNVISSTSTVDFATVEEVEAILSEV